MSDKQKTKQTGLGGVLSVFYVIKKPFSFHSLLINNLL